MHVIRKTTDLWTHTPFNLVVNVVHKTDDDDGMVNMLVCLFVGGCASSCVFVCVYVGGGAPHHISGGILLHHHDCLTASLIHKLCF